MNVIPISNKVGEPEPVWDDVGIHACDFRPHFDGHLRNLFTTITPLQTPAETESQFRAITIRIGQWVLDQRNTFHNGDRFQIIVGWPLTVRETGRQVIKTGGTFDEIKSLLDNESLIQVRDGWRVDVFPEGDVG